MKIILSLFLLSVLIDLTDQQRTDNADAEKSLFSEEPKEEDSAYRRRDPNSSSPPKRTNTDLNDGVAKFTTTISTIVVTPNPVAVCRDVKGYHCRSNRRYCSKKIAYAVTVSTRKNCPKTCGTCGTPFTDCGGTYESVSGGFRFPTSAGSNYPNHASCVWTLMKSNREEVNVTVHVADIERIYDTLKINGKFMKKGTYRFIGNSFRFEFSSDNDTTGRGFSVNWTAVNETQRELDLKTMISVSCKDEKFLVKVNKTKLGVYFPDVYPHTLRLNDPQCRGQVRSHTITFNTTIVGCGMTREETDTHIVYHNKLETQHNNNNSALNTFDIQCKVPRNTSAIGTFRTLSKLIVTGFGTFRLSFTFFQDSRYKREFVKYPIKVKLQQTLFADISLLSHDNNLTISLEQCMGLSMNTNHRQQVHMIFTNRCPTEKYIRYRQSEPNAIRFQFPAFNFVRRSRELYVRCNVFVCGMNATSSQCQRHCTRNQTWANSSRRRRSVDDDATAVQLSQGPIVLVEDDNQDGQTDGWKAATLGGTLGAFVVAAMVLALFKMKFILCARHRETEDS